VEGNLTEHDKRHSLKKTKQTICLVKPPFVDSLVKIVLTIYLKILVCFVPTLTVFLASFPSEIIPNILEVKSSTFKERDSRGVYFATADLAATIMKI
jgi:hypothetical protein